MKRLQIGLCAAIAVMLAVNIALRVRHEILTDDLRAHNESVLDDTWKAQQLAAHHCVPDPRHEGAYHCAK